MTRTKKPATAVVGVADHCGWAVLMTVADGALLDRRRVELVDDGLPSLPHHHECQALPIEEAVDLIGRVRASAERHAREGLDALAGAERITNYRAQTMADGVMYRRALADAATARGWRVHGYDARRVFAEAAEALQLGTIDDLLKRTRAAIGPPWQKDHRMAIAAAGRGNS
jgi:hypothetical protein